MKTFDELEHQYLNEHHERYAGFGRLLITLSVACITILMATSDSDDASPGVLFSLAVITQLFSLLAGVVVQHQLAMSPLRHLREAKTLVADALTRGEEGVPQKLYRRPEPLERVLFRVQTATFALSFVLMAVFLLSS